MIKAITCSKFVPKFSVNGSARLCPSCPNEPNVRNKSKSARDGPSVRNKGRAVRTVQLSERCPSDIWGFVRPKAEPRLFCPSRAELSENPNVRMSTPVSKPVFEDRLPRPDAHPIKYTLIGLIGPVLTTLFTGINSSSNELQSESVSSPALCSLILRASSS